MGQKPHPLGTKALIIVLCQVGVRHFVSQVVVIGAHTPSVTNEARVERGVPMLGILF